MKHVLSLAALLLAGPSPAPALPLQDAERPARIKVEGYAFVRLLESAEPAGWKTIPPDLKGSATISYSRSQNRGDVNLGVVEFEILAKGTLYLACDFSKGGRGGDWQKELWTADQFKEKGWEKVSEISTNDGFPSAILKKVVDAGEKFRLRTTKYHPPMPILKDPTLLAGLPAPKGAPASPAPAARAPVPSPEEQKKCEELVKDVFKSDYAKRQPTDRQALARKLFEEAQKITDPGQIYVTLREAMELAAQTGDADAALSAAEEMIRRFDVDALELKSKVLSVASKEVKALDAIRALVLGFLALSRDALARDNFKVAVASLQGASEQARRAKDPFLVSRASGQTRLVNDLDREFRAQVKNKEALASMPEDFMANLGWGKYLCFLKGSWDEGLPFLTRGNDQLLKDLAIRELTKSPELSRMIEQGDGWSDLAKKLSGISKEQVLQRARMWYGLALPQATGLLKSKVENRLSELQIAGLSSEPHYLGMLGRYEDTKGPVPFLFFSLPDGTNVYNNDVRTKMAGKAGDLIRFQARGRFALPRDTTINLEVGEANPVSIDGQKYDLGRGGKANGMAIPFRKGVHEIELNVGNNGGQLPGSCLRLQDKQTSRDIPIFFSEEEAFALLATRIHGALPLEVSGWKVQSANPELK